MAIRKTIYYTGKGGKDQSAINSAISGIESIFNGTKRELKKAVKEAGDIILANTLPITPKDTGDLRASGKAEVKDTEKGTQVRVSFGGDNIDYAVIVHEDMQPKNWTTEGTGPKYLEIGSKVSIPEIKTLLEQRAKESLKKKSKK